MKDNPFLEWIRDRLIEVHKENKDLDYMHKLQGIIDNYPEDKDSEWGNIKSEVEG